MSGSRFYLLLAACALPMINSPAARAVDTAVIEAEQKRIAVVAQVSPTVVAIFANGGGGGGSGVLISPDGYALTNFHVTSGAGNFMKCGLADGVLYDAVIVGIDPTGDVALIKLVGRDDFPFARMGDSSTLNVGDWAFAMGNPFLLATDFQPTITYGIVSGIHRYQYPAGTILEYTDCIQVDASINPGNSGGPLFNAVGELVGINGRGSFEKRGRVNSGAGYAISINQIKHFMDHLRSGRIVDHATLGATVSTRSDQAVVVANILEASDAYRRGLRVDDEIVSFGGRSIGSVNQFKNVLGIYPKGWKLPLTFRHEGKKQEIFVRLRGLHRKSELVEGPRPKPAEPVPEKEPKKPGEKPSRKPSRPQSPHMAAPAKPPEHLAKLFVEKTGFANYYFNQLEQARTLKGLVPLGDFAQAKGTWKVTGTLDKDAPFELTLADRGAGLTVDGGKKTFFQPLAGDVELEDEPPGTGGLLLALHHFRLLLSKGPQAFTDFYYLGSEPLDGQGESVDVLVAELTGAQSYWYFSREKGALVGFDLRRTEDAESCEIRFGASSDFGGRQLPASLVVRYADAVYATLYLQNWTFLPPVAELPAEKPAEKKPAEATPKAEES